jgi:hypothetical protein
MQVTNRAENAGRCTSSTCAGGCEKEQRRFYATAKDGQRAALLLGPFQTHQEALDAVPAARRAAQEVDGRAWFWEYGTVLMEPGPWPDGKLNGAVA